MRALPFLLVLVLLAAGCVTVPEEPLSPQAEADAEALAALGGFPDPLLVEHDHADLAAHALSTPTMDLLHRETFASLGVPTPAFGEADLLGEDHLVVSALLNGFYVVDVSDAAKPVAVSYTPMPGFIADVKASESGDFVFLGIQLAGFTGVQAWNVAVRERPVLAGSFPMQGGCHMLAVHAGHLYCSPNDATVRIFRIVETPAAVALVPVGAYAPKGAPPTPFSVDRSDAGDEFTHDMTVQDDPLTGEPVMFVSFWEYGVRVVDVKDPANPVELGAWTGLGAEGTYEGNVHTTMAALVDGRRVIATVPEYATVPSLTFLDATDYGNMAALGAWAPKRAEDFGADDPKRFSTHNFQFVGGKVYMAMYHGGVWVVDASTVEAVRAPRALGYYLPADGPAAQLPTPTAFLGGGSPNTWDVVVKDGVILATDIVGGLYALRHETDALGDASLTSFA